MPRAWRWQLLNVSCLSPRISSQRKKKGFDVGYCVGFDTEGWAAQSAHRTGLRYVPIVRSTVSVCYSYAILPAVCQRRRKMNDDMCSTGQLRRSFFNYVDQVLPITDHIPAPCRHCLGTSFTVCKRKSANRCHFQNYLPPLVNVVKERPPYVTCAASFCFINASFANIDD